MENIQTKIEKNRQMKKVLLLWYTVGGNFGDVLIYKTVSEYCNNSNILCDFIDVGRPCSEIMQKANKYDFLLFAGGGIIERYVPNVIRYFKEDFDMLKVPYGVIGLSVGRFDYSRYSGEIAFWVENAKFFFTRDAYSAKRLNSICGKKIVVDSTDVVWANERIYFNKIKMEKNIGINVRDVPYLDIQTDIDWKKLECRCKKERISCFIPDESGIELKGLEKCFYEEQKVFDQIVKCEFLVAMRYHVILVAAANGIPAIPIAYCNKIKELSSQLGLEKYVLNTNEIDLLPAKIELLRKNLLVEQEQLYANTRKMKKQAKKMLEKILETINNA